jgi:hypothetical protein
MARYDLHISYDPSVKLGESDIRSSHPDIWEAAEAFATCTAPFKQLVFVDDDGSADWLDELEEDLLARICDAHGYDLEEFEG